MYKTTSVDKLVESKLPRFKEMCESKDGSDSIIFSSDAFGNTPRELMLLGSAVKYGTLRGFNIMITFDGDITIK